VTWGLGFGTPCEPPLEHCTSVNTSIVGFSSSLYETEKVGEAMCVYGLHLFDDENIVPLECMVVLLLL
jgi:hypothetical protein